MGVSLLALISTIYFFGGKARDCRGKAELGWLGSISLQASGPSLVPVLDSSQPGTFKGSQQGQEVLMVEEQTEPGLNSGLAPTS